jgi:hypothetical protein
VKSPAETTGGGIGGAGVFAAGVLVSGRGAGSVRPHAGASERLSTTIAAVRARAIDDRDIVTRRR